MECTKEPPCRAIEKSHLQDVAPILPCSFRRSVTILLLFQNLLKIFLIPDFQARNAKTQVRRK